MNDDTTVEQLRAENERFRKALQDIIEVTGETDYSFTNAMERQDEAWEIAYTALHGDEAVSND